MYVATERADYLVVRASAEAGHRAHIVLHELGHALLDHQPPGGADADAPRLTVPGMDPQVVARALGRTTYEQEQERQAEVFATRALARTRWWRRPPRRVVRPGQDEMVERIARSLGEETR